MNKAKEAKWRKAREGENKRVEGGTRKRPKSEFIISRTGRISSMLSVARGVASTSAVATEGVEAVPTLIGDATTNVGTDDGVTVPHKHQEVSQVIHLFVS